MSDDAVGYRYWQAPALPDPGRTGPALPRASKPLDAAAPADVSDIDLKALVADWKAKAEGRGYEVGNAAGYAAGLEKGHAAGYRSGLDEGRKAGRETALEEEREQADARLAHLDGLLHEAAAALDAFDGSVARTLADLAWQIAHAIVRDELSVSPDKVLAIIRAAIAAAPADASLTLWLHPEDLALVAAARPAPAGDRPCRLAADPSLERGGCRITTAIGQIDATLAARWDAARKLLDGQA